jgi:hypothetical protein
VRQRAGTSVGDSLTQVVVVSRCGEGGAGSTRAHVDDCIVQGAWSLVQCGSAQVVVVSRWEREGYGGERSLAHRWWPGARGTKCSCARGDCTARIDRMKGRWERENMWSP